jgi:hypothetical protein
MLSHEALRQAAKTVPAVLVDSAQLLELLDAAERAPKPRKPRAAHQDTETVKDEECARWLYGALLNTMPKAKQPNYASWARDIRLMRERDYRTRKEICELFRWAHGNSFWCSNILSPAKLRDHWNRLSIQRNKELEPKKQGAGAWWASDATREAKAIEVGVGPARAGDTKDSYEARIRAAIDNGGKPPAPAAAPRPLVSPPPLTEQVDQRAQKPEGMGALKDLVRKVVLPARAP